MTAEQTRFDLSVLAACELAEVGARLRRCAEDRSATVDEIARAIVDTLWDAFEERTPPTLALVRLYRTRFARELEPAWNEVAESRDHGVLPLSDPEARTRAPIAAELVAELARDPAGAARRFVPEVVGSRLVAAQRRFVLRYGVRAALGCGGALPDGSAYALVVYSRVPIAAEVAAAFSSVGWNAELALGRASDLCAPPEAVLAARARAAERLLAQHEAVLAGLAGQMTRDADAARRLELPREARAVQADERQRGRGALLECVPQRV
ncbi:MAG TPA: hypothetical protein VN253_30150, partial [Kofleriaceae bacterium]|nr:hypothetical protein [Kofleriaceae bacterium]